MFGGSTDTAVSGAMSWLAQHDARELTAVAIAPDLGRALPARKPGLDALERRAEGGPVALRAAFPPANAWGRSYMLYIYV